jgi:hypothetical protein
MGQAFLRQLLKSTPLLSVLFLLPLCLPAADVSPQKYLEEVQYLASPALKGRATGSPELEKAAGYIAAQFKTIGLKPLGGNDYRQEFPVALGSHLGTNNSIAWTLHGSSAPASTTDSRPFSFSSSGTFSAPVVFAGYGVTDKERSYDDYSGIDVTGKIVLILRHEPKEGAQPSAHAAFIEKAINAKMHGARGVVLVNDLYAHDGRADDLDKFAQTEGPSDVGIPFVQVKSALAERWANVSDLTAQINRDFKPHSFAIDGLSVTLTVEILREAKTVHNVAGFLPGSTSEYVIIGAHYDHLGLGDSHSLAPSQIGQVHPGADDNASGTAGVIELARWFAQQPKQKRGILFLTFAGEELGLLGSAWYVNHPLLPLEHAVAMINMDMIGRIRDGKIYLNGSGTGSTFPGLIDEVKPPAALHLDLAEKTGYGSSDHTSFTTKQIPVLFFFSGLHGDYHKPSDTADKIDAADAAKLLDYIAALASHLASDPGRPQFVRVTEPSQPVTTSSGGGSGYGPAFGSIPDFNEPPKGVRFADVRDGTPAAVAGLRAGDILIEFDGKEIANLYDFTYALRAHKPGDSVLVKVIRGSQEIEAKVLLTERK